MAILGHHGAIDAARADALAWAARGRSALEALLAKTAVVPTVRSLGEAQLGVSADHFAWMKKPGAVAGLVVDWMGTLGRPGGRPS